MDIESRKNDHIKISLERDVQVDFDHWDDVFLLHEAVPSHDMEDIDLGVRLLGKEVKAPIVISSMTGGSPRAKEINELLAKAASEYGLAMGVGSQRAAIQENRHRDSYEVVKEFDIPLVFGNIGAPQISGDKGMEVVRSMIADGLDMIDGDAMYIHLNYLQEVVQKEGETIISGFLENMGSISNEFTIAVKETGAGISRDAALDIKEAGAKLIDVAGASGTSFAAVESYRGSDEPSRIGRTFWNWGIPSPVSLLLADVGLPLISSGGIRNGLDVVRSLSLGATAAGMAWHLLVPASKGYKDLCAEIENLMTEIRAGLFLSGAGSASEGRKVKYYLTGRTSQLMEQIRE